MAFWDILWLRCIRWKYHGSIHGGWVSAQGSAKCIQGLKRSYKHCGFEAIVYDATSAFDDTHVTTSNPTPIPIGALAPAAVSEPMNLGSMEKLCEELHAYIGEQRNETPGDVCGCFNSGYRETDRKIAARIQHPSDEGILIGQALEPPVKSTARIKSGHFSHAPRGEKGLHS